MSHFITKCDCGNVISQCRCFSKEKIETVVPHGCASCKAASSPAKEDKQRHLTDAIEKYFREAGKGPWHPCGKCFKWKECECTEDMEKEAGKPEQLAKAIEKTHWQHEDEADQTASALKKLHKGEQDQLAVEIRKKHVNKD